MGWPRATLIMVNYNSSGILGLVKESIEAIARLDYPDDAYEFIFVDNASSDGSFEKLKEWIDARGPARSRIIRLQSNVGFAGGANVGFKARDPLSKYVVVVNNDAIPTIDSLRNLVGLAEQHRSIAALNGIVLRRGTNSFVDAAGGFIDEVFNTYLVSGNIRPRRMFYASYADGAFALYRVSSVLQCLGDRLYPSEFFAYFEDVFSSLKLWSCGFSVAVAPRVVARHQRGASFRKASGVAQYLHARNRLAALLCSNSRLKSYGLAAYARNSLAALTAGAAKPYTRALWDAMRLARSLRHRYGLLNIYNAPLLRPHLASVLGPRRLAEGRVVADFSTFLEF